MNKIFIYGFIISLVFWLGYFFRHNYPSFEEKKYCMQNVLDVADESWFLRDSSKEEDKHVLLVDDAAYLRCLNKFGMNNLLK